MDNRSMPSATIIPVLGYKDVSNAIAWLCRTFGFKERWRAGDHRAQLAFGNGAIAVNDQPGQISNLMVRVPYVDAHYEHALAAGAQIIHPPADYPYGERQYTVVDPGGHFWTFTESIDDLLPEDWGGVTS
ncbi:glyoxalase [Chitinophaga sp. SYP-B3965]|uniref:VOC family protein n=1 Tax=Chitinophaga sp. SYP-B3965 TaxID=2663120 RepID=UPI0012998D31|nr:VOC family protein [Chitinophaga sp. SYP-B3965]MRG47971.1 glyoxalase [Chitinophaga sp. SYP-B3965]